MTSKELRKKFLDYFEKNGHKIVPSFSLLPINSSVLFTTAGMQQFTSHLQGKDNPIKGFNSQHLTSCQKCFRSDDIEEIGDDTHHSFFEMLGNWSIGQNEKGEYFKQGAIEYALDFLINELGLEKDKLYITIFKGNEDIPKDNESINIWQGQGIEREKIKEFGEEDNLWGPVGETGICGSCSEIYYDRGQKFGCGKKECGPNCQHCKRFVEIWNLVFIEYAKDENKKYKLLNQKSVDTGMGLERIISILQNKPSAYETDLFVPIIQEIEKQGDKKYQDEKKNFRIIADHVRGSIFLISEGVLPSNIEQGYILRRILRRAIRYGKIIKAEPQFLIPLAKKTIDIYKDIYPEIALKQADILTVIQKEEEKFEKTLEKGLIETTSVIDSYVDGEDISGKAAFDLYQTYGFPIEMIKELADEHNKKVDKKEFEQELKKHQEISRAGKDKKFGGGGKFSPKLHTATHLLHSALRQILGEKVQQMGSDITEERLRFDFSFERKLLPEELKQIENLVNEKIKQNLPIKEQKMDYKKAVELGALAFFKEKYPDIVSVYSINNFSKEICAGPHANKTSELGKFKIIKEKSSSAGIRRIKAILE